jgi:hypothetical protein
MLVLIQMLSQCELRMLVLHQKKNKNMDAL